MQQVTGFPIPTRPYLFPGNRRFLKLKWLVMPTIAPSHPSPCQNVVSLSQSSCVSPVEFSDGGGGGQIRKAWSLVLYKSFDTLWRHRTTLLAKLTDSLIWRPSVMKAMHQLYLHNLYRSSVFLWILRSFLQWLQNSKNKIHVFSYFMLITCHTHKYDWCRCTYGKQ